MVESENEGYNSKPIWWIYANWSPKSKAIAQIYNRSSTFSGSMKRSVRPIFSLLLLLVVAATFGCRVAIQNGVGSVYGDIGADTATGSSDESLSSSLREPLDFPLFNSTLLKLSQVEAGEPKLRQEIEQLLGGNFGSSIQLRTFATWRRFFNKGDMWARTSTGMPVSRGSLVSHRVWLSFRRALSDWSRKRRFQPDIMEELVDLVKVPIDRHNNNNNGLVGGGQRRKYSSCAVVGNSGILLTKEFGGLIDSHEAVIRLNNARVEPYQRNVGSKTSISFVNSNILHLCARREDCYCHPYGVHVPIVMYMCQPAQFLDYVVCNSTHKSPLIVTDPRFDVISARIVKYYSLKRFADGTSGPNRTLEHWDKIHDGSLFHYSSGMQAVMMALGICDQVSLFGFGKSNATKHHYHTNQKSELGLHDYQAEYDFYRDLVERPRSIPFISPEFKFPPVLIHR